MSQDLIACVLYAAKSTEDRHGSIPDQFRECRAAIEEADGRHVFAEYFDEAVSAYHRDRGEGLIEAMQHVEDLAQELGTAELWAQHSDRLARGDGRSARHVVEVGLWALKRDVTVRTIQDPDTFRDLLYAVVTGQRNHEDSRRKSLAVSAGHRRAAERGDHVGPRPDGYRVVVEVDDAGAVTRRLEFDPKRQLAIALIFRLGLKGKGATAIAQAVNNAGWRTKPGRHGSEPRSWTVHGVLGVLRNPRYAGLATYKGEIVGTGHWPAYITERQHHRIRARLAQRRQPKQYRPLEAYLFARLVCCGYCGGSMSVHTGRERKDATFSRRYVCTSHLRDCSADACKAPRIDADTVESMFVSAMPVLFGEDTTPTASKPEHPMSLDRAHLVDAVRANDDQAIDRALEELLGRMHPETALTERLAGRMRRARQREAFGEFEAWARSGILERTEPSRQEVRRLNAVLHNWLSRVVIAIHPETLSIVVQHRATATAPPRESSVSFARSEWRGFSPAAMRNQPHIYWERADILAALRCWADVNGHTPRSRDWALGNFEHPNAATVRRHFTSWRLALRAARLKPANPQAVRVWGDEEIVRALQAWSRRHGRPPRGYEWMRGTPLRPCSTTVYNHFGTWKAALSAAGI